MNHNYLVLIPLGLALLAFGLLAHGKRESRWAELRREILRTPMTRRHYNNFREVDLSEFRRSCPHAAQIVGAQSQPAEHDAEAFREFIAGLDVRGL